MLRTPSLVALIGSAILGGGLLAGCGGVRERPAASAGAHAAIVKRNKIACERAVQTPPGLSASAKRELADLCFRINYIPEDNERTVRSACEEAANASRLASASARRRAAADCYAQGFLR